MLAALTKWIETTPLNMWIAINEVVGFAARANRAHPLLSFGALCR